MAVEVGQQRKHPGNGSAFNKADEYAVTLFKSDLRHMYYDLISNFLAFNFSLNSKIVAYDLNVKRP